MPRSSLLIAQKEDASLTKCFATALALEITKNREVADFVEDDLLMRRWKSCVDLDIEWSNVFQIIVPTPYKQSVLSLAHGHLGSQNPTTEY